MPGGARRHVLNKITGTKHSTSQPADGPPQAKRVGTALRAQLIPVRCRHPPVAMRAAVSFVTMPPVPHWVPAGQRQQQGEINRAAGWPSQYACFVAARPECVAAAFRAFSSAQAGVRTCCAGVGRQAGDVLNLMDGCGSRVQLHTGHPAAHAAALSVACKGPPGMHPWPQAIPPPSTQGSTG